MTTNSSPSGAFDAFEAAGWERAVSAYETFFGPITDELIGPILDTTCGADGTRLLDIGCGPGRLVAHAAVRGVHPVGLDVSSAMVHRARAAHPDLEFHVGDAHRLPFPDGSFDIVTANFSILHLGHPELAVAEFARVLVPGGRIAITTWDRPERARLFGWVLEALERANAEAPIDIPDGPPFFRFADDRELRVLLEGNGLHGVVVRTVAFTHPAPSTGAIWSGLVDGTVRTSALIRRQTPAVQEAINTAFDELVSAANPEPPIEIPVSVKLASARR